MKILRVALISLLAMTVSPVFAKGNLVNITVNGANLAAPIGITDSAITAFTPWAGPGVTINGIKQTEGFIVDWLGGAMAERPMGLQHYELSFFAKLHGKPVGAKEELVHVVSYEFDPLTGQGYVYVPSQDDERYQVNASYMRHPGFEGKWYRANHAWEDFVNPLILKATNPVSH